MGTAASKGSEGWHPAPADGVKERRISKSGYDVAPLTAEEREKQAAQLTDFQK
jgi:hypothetical protein